MANKFMDDEKTLFNKIQSVATEDTCLLTNSKSEEMIDLIIKNKNIWTNNSEDTNNPPDFYCDKHKIMGDLMQVDDCGHYVINGKKTKYVNHEKRANSRMYNELKNSDLLDSFPNVTEVIVLPNTSDIPTHQHHRYEWYVSEFDRIVTQHIESIKLYKKKFPDYKTIFFIYDEAKQYVELDTCLYSDKFLYENKLGIKSRLHIPFFDENFLNILKKKTQLDDNTYVGIDFVVWCLEYRYSNTPDGMLRTLPRLVILDVKNIDMVELIKYSPICLRSTEA